MSNYTIINGDNLTVLKTYPDNHFDSIVTDPPYGISFLGKDWDAHTGEVNLYKECLRVLKPGGHLLAFSAARTYHKLATSIEEAGFEIRDQLMWIYSSGFPKSQDVGKSIDRAAGIKKQPDITPPREEGYVYGKGTTGFYPKCPNCEVDRRKCVCGYRSVETDAAKQWQGWGTALKPAHEPIVMARKPVKQSIAKNVQEYGTGALNIDATRIPTDDVIISSAGDNNTFTKYATENNVDGPGTGNKINANVPKWTQSQLGRFPSNVLGDIPDYQKYFYCPKVSRKERHLGFTDNDVITNPVMVNQMGGYFIDKDNNPTTDGSNMLWLPQTGNIYVHGLKEEYRKWCATNNKNPLVGNNHPTVKPVALMSYLIKLVTPPNGHVLDPFNGSGSTGMAAVENGFTYTGIDLDANYVEISKKRIAAWLKKDEPKAPPANTNFEKLFVEDKK